MRRATSFKLNRSLQEHRRFDIEVPRGSVFLHCDLDHDIVWFEVEHHTEIELRSFRLYGPDEPIDLDFKFCKTIAGRTRETTVHLYEKVR